MGGCIGIVHLLRAVAGIDTGYTTNGSLTTTKLRFFTAGVVPCRLAVDCKLLTSLSLRGFFFFFFEAGEQRLFRLTFLNGAPLDSFSHIT